MSALKSRFDWYSATFEFIDAEVIAAGILEAFGTVIIRGKGHLGYGMCTTIEADGMVIAKVYSGSSRAGEVHVVVSGDACDAVVPYLRERWPEHRVSRADAAMDFKADFDDLDAQALAFAVERKLSYRLVTDSEGGATRYLGSPSSAVMVRLYKKSEQLRKLYPNQAAEVEDGIVRAEIQVRPTTKAKAGVASMSADDLWGVGKWAQEFARLFLDIEAERVSMNFWRVADWERSMQWLGHQYGPGVTRRIEEVGFERAKAEVLAAVGLGDPVSHG